MKDHPILFSGPLVRAILSGEKTQTRRLLRWDGVHRAEPTPIGPAGNWSLTSYGGSLRVVRCPFGAPGDRLWVRETWAALGNEDGRPVNAKGAVVKWGPGVACVYRADTKPGKYGAYILPDGSEWFGKWRPSIHMPRWASRVSLEVTEVRVQRVLDITEEEARTEGVHEHPLGKAVLDAKGTHKGAFLAVWEEINGARPGGSLADNPWVWAITFRRVQP